MTEKTPAAAPAAEKAPVAPLTGQKLVDSILAKKDGATIRLIAPGGRLGNATQPEVVYGQTVSTKRRVADIKENRWEQMQIAAGVLVIESDDAGE